jgi:hypothetical protein
MDFLSTSLSLEQMFQLRLMEECAVNMSRDEAISLLIQASRLLMLKDNVIRQLIIRVIDGEVNQFKLGPNSA